VSTSGVASTTLLSSTIGRKAVMAATGLLLYGFVVGHMLGNLQVFLGPEAINAYAEFLQHFLHGQGVWIARATLLLALLLHVWAAVSLALQNASARPTGYREWQARESTYASRTMVWSGPLLLVFVVYHLAHFTVGNAHPDFVRGDVFRNLVVGFQNPFASAFYILAMLALGLHMYHGFWSMLQSLGLSHPRWNRVRRGLSLLLAGAVIAGNISIPLAVLTGRIHL
jgi:succinate dehydrogenase / fumarate reductase cytochrome b subunit